ncbi:MAG: serine--tRNA ligase [Deltaproteobacteria bacterium]|nr:serine--tRNA ligase [Deltaproteobacteria bacterium]
MLDLRHVTDHLDEVRAALGRRSAQAAALLEPIAQLAAERREVIAAEEARAAERNAASKAMARLDKGSPEFAARRAELKDLGEDAKALSERRAQIEGAVQEKLAELPNLPDATVPSGSSAEDNPVLGTWGERPACSFAPLPHWDLGPQLGVVDFERAAKLSGPRFSVMVGAGARLERALIGFMLDLHTREHGYTEIVPPFLVKDAALFGTGQLPKFAADLFRIEKRDPDKAYELYLIPTAEVPLTNLHADEILEAASLPLGYVAYTPCFRSEAGSHGKDVRGMIRQHQFNKVELVRLCTPESSAAELELLTRHAEEVLRRLGLHYRRVELCAGDLGFAACKTYDLEIWLPSQGAYREISSCSNCGDFQARRAKIRYRPQPGGKPRLLHTLNGSGLAVGRTVIGILEQCQRADGSVIVPEALRPHFGGEVICAPDGRCASS